MQPAIIRSPNGDVTSFPPHLLARWLIIFGFQITASIGGRDVI